MKKYFVSFTYQPVNSEGNPSTPLKMGGEILTLQTNDDAPTSVERRLTTAGVSLALKDLGYPVDELKILYMNAL